METSGIRDELMECSLYLTTHGAASETYSTPTWQPKAQGLVVGSGHAHELEHADPDARN